MDTGSDITLIDSKSFDIRPFSPIPIPPTVVRNAADQTVSTITQKNTVNLVLVDQNIELALRDIFVIDTKLKFPFILGFDLLKGYKIDFSNASTRIVHTGQSKYILSETVSQKSQEMYNITSYNRRPHRNALRAQMGIVYSTWCTQQWTRNYHTRLSNTIWRHTTFRCGNQRAAFRYGKKDHINQQVRPCGTFES